MPQLSLGTCWGNFILRFPQVGASRASWKKVLLSQRWELMFPKILAPLLGSLVQPQACHGLGW